MDKDVTQYLQMKLVDALIAKKGHTNNKSEEWHRCGDFTFLSWIYKRECYTYEGIPKKR